MDLQQISASAVSRSPPCHGSFGGDRLASTSELAARYAVPAAAQLTAADAGSTLTDAGSAGVRFRRAIYRVLIALSFKSFRHRNETKRRRERSDCSEARFLPAAALTPVEDDTLAPEDDIQYVALVRRSAISLYMTCLWALSAHDFTPSFIHSFVHSFI